MAVEWIDRARSLFGRTEPETPAAAPRKVQHPFHAVSIVPGPRACGAADRLQGKRFLSRMAPTLPLKDCDRGQCECHYAHHDDRRKSGRRARDLGISIDAHAGEERRDKSSRGRRKSET